MAKVVFKKLKVKTNNHYPALYTVFALDSKGRVWKRDHDQLQWTELTAPDEAETVRLGSPQTAMPDAQY